MTFRSAIDLWYWLVVAVTGVAVVLAAAPVLMAGAAGPATLIALAALLAVGMPLWLAFSTDYTVTSDVLLIRSGPFAWRVPLAEIHDVQPSRSVLASPALSLDRLAIKYGRNKTILVSPKDKVAFMGALKKR